MKKIVGEIVCEPLGTYAISELQLEDVLKVFREHCKKEVADYRAKSTRGRGEHWFNEKMKASRKLTTFLTENRICNGVPAGIKNVTKKFKLRAKAHPIPPDILRAIWKEAVAMEEAARQQFLSVVAVDRLKRLNEIVSREARPWTEYYDPVPTSTQWWVTA